MFGSIVAFVALAGGPRTFEDLELEMIKAYRGQKSLHEVIEFKIMGAAGHIIRATRDTEMDGKRCHVLAQDSDGNSHEFIDDGINHWLIDKTKKTYSEAKDSVVDPKEYLLKSASSSYSAQITDGLPFEFASNPEPVLQGIETSRVGNETLRRADAQVGDKRVELTVTQWFMPGTWMLTRAEVDDPAVTSGPTVEAIVTVLDTKAKFSDTDFAFNPATVKDYQKIN